MNDFIMDIISIHCNNDRMQAARVYQYAYLLQYLDKKTQSVDKSGDHLQIYMPFMFLLKIT